MTINSQEDPNPARPGTTDDSQSREVILGGVKSGTALGGRRGPGERTGRWRGSGSAQAGHPLGDTRWAICARGDALRAGPGRAVQG